MKTKIATARMSQEDFVEAGLVVGVDAEGTSTCDSSGRMLVNLYSGLAVRKVSDAPSHCVTEWNYSALEELLDAAGGTLRETEELLAILAEEGWGGREYEADIPYAAMVTWFRECRA